MRMRSEPSQQREAHAREQDTATGPRLGSRKVAFVASIFGHFRAFHRPFMQWFLDQGWEVYAYAKPDGSESILQAMGVNCQAIAIERSPLSRRNLRAYRQLREGFRNQQFELVHVHTPVASVIGRLAAAAEKVPAVLYTAHGFHFFRGAPLQNWLLYYPLESWLARKTDFLLTINQEDYERARKFPVREQVFQVSGVGVEVPPLVPEEVMRVREKLRQELDLDPAAFVFLCIAEFNANKNHKQILDALEELQQSGGIEGLQCLFVCRGPDEAKLRVQIGERKLQHTVHVLGYRTDVPDLLLASDAVILTSKREGLPRALLEAMAAGKPILATNTRGSRDLVASGENGWLIPIAGVADTVRAMEHFLQHPVQVQQMGQQSRRMVEAYKLPEVLTRMAEIYHIAMNYAENRS